MRELGMGDLPPLDPPEVPDESSGIATYYTRDQVIEHMCAAAEHVRTILAASAAPAEGREEVNTQRRKPFKAYVSAFSRAKVEESALAIAPTMSGEIVGYLVDDPNEPDIGHWFDEGKPNRDLGLRARPLTFAAPTMSEAANSALVEAVMNYIGALDAWDGSVKAERYTKRKEIAMRAALAEVRREPPSDCSGDPTNCPDNEGRGCFCSDKECIDRAAAKGESDA